MGLEMPDSLIWRGWDPGEDYTKKLVVKNTSNHWVALQHKANLTNAFDMCHPGSVKIPPGMSHAFSIVFQPIDMMEYHDQVRAGQRR